MLNADDDGARSSRDGLKRQTKFSVAVSLFLALVASWPSPSNTSAASIAKKGVLRLYRDCLKSAHRIPDGSQRSMYLDYTRQGFRDRARLPHDATEVRRAVKDTEEQLESMNYYHSIRELKERGEHQATATSSTHTASATIAQVRDSTKKQAITERQATSHHKELQQTTGVLLEEKREVVETWLMAALPELHPDDLVTYSQQLVGEGFDSLSLLESELLEDDLDFAKKAHRRAIVRFYKVKPASYA